MACNLHTSATRRHEVSILRALRRSGVTLRAHYVVCNALAAHGCDPVRQGRIWVDAKHLAHVAPVPGSEQAACDAGGPRLCLPLLTLCPIAPVWYISRYDTSMDPFENYVVCAG